MTKYIIAVLLLIAGLAGLLLYIGDDVKLLVSSTAPAGPLSFSPIELTWQFAILAGAALFAAIIGLWSVLLWLWRLPRRVKSGVGLRRRNQALDAMEDALVAGAEGDVNKARKKAEKARALIASTDLGRIISAQAAEACGDTEEAVSQYEAMLESDKTRATAQRGLAQNKLATGDIPGAIEQASQAYRENKSARWAFDTLFKAQVADHQWSAAAETLATGESRKHIAPNIAERRRTVLRTAEADRLHDQGQNEPALERAVQACSADPGFAPAAALASKLYLAAGSQKKGLGLIEKAWAKAPHPALSLAYLDLLALENDKTRAKKIEGLIKLNPNHRETTILLAEEALRSGDAVKAWSQISRLLNDAPEPSARLCLLAAQAEARLQNGQDARVWLERAATAPREDDWSDLDPTGEAFDYSDNDWRRLVFSYGETGELIHPRAERQAAHRAPGVVSAPDTVITEAPKEDEADLEPANDPVMRQPDDPGVVENITKKDDLAGRLDSLLDKD